MGKSARTEFARQLVDAASYLIEQGVADGIDHDLVCEEQLLAITQLAAELAGMPIEEAISDALLANDMYDVGELAVSTIAKVPRKRVGEFLVSAEVSTILNFCENGRDRPLLTVLESTDPEEVARYLWKETDAAGWAKTYPEALDIASFVGTAVKVIPIEPSAHRAYWWLVARLIWGMVCGDSEWRSRLTEGLQVFGKSQG